MYRRNSKYSKNNKFNKDCMLEQKWLMWFVIFPPEPSVFRFMTITYTIINRNKDWLFKISVSILHMFGLSDARDYSFLKVPYLEGEEEITNQSNFVNNVTYFYFRFPRPLKKNGRQTGEKLSKAEKAFAGYCCLTTRAKRNMKLLTSSQLLEVVTSKNDDSLTLCTVNL